MKFHKPRSGKARFRAKKFHQKKKHIFEQKAAIFIPNCPSIQVREQNCSNQNQIGAKVLEKAGNSKPKIPQHALSKSII